MSGTDKAESKEEIAKQKKISDIDQIGKGTYSKVYRTNENTVIKKYRNKYKEGVSYDMIREIAVLKYIQSPHVISVLQIDENYEHVTLPFYKMSMFDLLRKITKNKICITEEQIKRLFYTLCLGVSALHSKGIVHRDIKPDNVMINLENYNSVLIDTGFAKPIYTFSNWGQFYTSGNLTPDKICSTWYRAPEVFLNEQNYSLGIDIWSLGCILGELYMKKPVFEADTELEILLQQFKLIGCPKELDSSGKLYKVYPSKIAAKFLDSLVQFPGCFADVFSEYGRDFCHLLFHMFKINYKKRYTITDCLNHQFFNDINHENNIQQNYLETYKSHLRDYKINIDANNQYKDIFNYRRLDILLHIIEVCNYYDLCDSIYFRTVSILDNYLLMKNKSADKDSNENKNLFLVSLACLWIAMKLETQKYFDIHDLEYISNSAFSQKQFEETEKEILRVLDFKLMAPILSEYLIFLSTYHIQSYKILRVYLYICTLDDIHITYNFNEIILACLEILGYSKNNNIEVVNRVKTLLDDYIINGKAQLQCITSLIMRFGKQMDEMMDK